MRSDDEVQREFGAAYPHLFLIACEVVSRFYRYDNAAVEGAVSETMARAFENWEQVRDHEKPGEWIVVTAKDVCLEKLRDTATRRLTMEEQNDGDVILPRETVISTELWKTLEPLSTRQRDVAALRFLMDCDDTLAASALGTTVPEVRTAAREARSHLAIRIGTVYPQVDQVDEATA